MFFCEAAARRSSGLYRFKFLSTFNTSADVVDYFAQGCSHWYFYQAYIIYFSCQGKYFRSF